MLFKINSNPMHSLSVALPLPYVPARVTRGGLAARRHSFAPLASRTSQYRWTFVPLAVSMWNDLDDPVFDGLGLNNLDDPVFGGLGLNNLDEPVFDGLGRAGFKNSANASCCPNLLFHFVSSNFLFSLLPWVGCVVLGSSD